MRTIEIKFPRFLFGFKTITTSFPTCWNELTPRQLTVVAGLLFLRADNIYLFRAKVLKALLNLNHLQVLALGDRLVDLYPYIDFLEKDNTLTQNKYEYITAGKMKFYGPIGNFETLIADEWTEADESYIEFLRSKQEKDLDRMIAVLFRPRKKGIWKNSLLWKNDWREDFNEYSVSLRAQYFASLDKRIKFAILTWYQGCRLEWEGVFERVFKGNQSDMESFGWQETIQKLSGPTFGTLQETGRTYMYKLMLGMEITLKDEEIRKEMEKAQRMKHAH